MTWYDHITVSISCKRYHIAFSCISNLRLIILKESQFDLSLSQSKQNFIFPLPWPYKCSNRRSSWKFVANGLLLLELRSYFVHINDIIGLGDSHLCGIIREFNGPHHIRFLIGLITWLSGKLLLLAQLVIEQLNFLNNSNFYITRSAVHTPNLTPFGDHANPLIFCMPSYAGNKLPEYLSCILSFKIK